MSLTKVRPPFAERIKKGLEEIILHIEGKIELKTTVIEIPDPPPAIDRAGIVSLRDRLKLTPASFARLLNVPASTLRLWEAAKRKPSGASLRLLQVYSERPEVVEHVVRASATPGLNGTAKRRVPVRV